MIRLVPLREAALGDIGVFQQGRVLRSTKEKERSRVQMMLQVRLIQADRDSQDYYFRGKAGDGADEEDFAGTFSYDTRNPNGAEGRCYQGRAGVTFPLLSRRSVSLSVRILFIATDFLLFFEVLCRQRQGCEDTEEVEDETEENVSAKNASHADEKCEVGDGGGDHVGPHAENEGVSLWVWVRLIPGPHDHEGPCCSPGK